MCCAFQQLMQTVPGFNTFDQTWLKKDEDLELAREMHLVNDQHCFAVLDFGFIVAQKLCISTLKSHALEFDSVISKMVSLMFGIQERMMDCQSSYPIWSAMTARLGIRWIKQMESQPKMWKNVPGMILEHHYASCSNKADEFEREQFVFESFMADLCIYIKESISTQGDGSLNRPRSQSVLSTHRRPIIITKPKTRDDEHVSKIENGVKTFIEQGISKQVSFISRFGIHHDRIPTTVASVARIKAPKGSQGVGTCHVAKHVPA